MSNARDFASRVPVDGALSNRNVIVNGRFDVWQRSTGPVTNSGYTTVDRWRFPASGITSEQVSNDRDLSIPYALKVTADGTGYGITQTRIEDVRTLSGKDATFSIWVKSPTTGAFRFFIEQNFGSGGSSTVSILDNASQFSIASANTWEQFTVTVTMPSISGKTLGTAHHVSLGIGANSGTANRVMYYSEAQLEVGDTVTPFEHPRSYSDELARCQRYYEIGVVFGQYKGVDDTGGWAHYKVTKRANPSISIFPPDNSASNYGYYYSTISSDRGNRLINEINPSTWFVGQVDYTAGFYAIMGAFTPASDNDATWVANYRADAEL